MMTTVPLWIGTVPCIYVLEHCLSSAIVVAHKILIVGSLHAQLRQEVFGFCAPSLVGNATGRNGRFQFFLFFLPGYSTERIGEIIQCVHVRLVNLLKHYLIRFDTFNKTKRNLGQTQSKAILDHLTVEQEKIYFYYQGGHLTKQLLGLLICVYGLKPSKNLSSALCNKACSYINSDCCLSILKG